LERGSMQQFIANGLCKGATYSLVALGFGLIYSTLGVFHIAHGAVFVATAYAFYWSAVVVKLPLGLAVATALLAAMVVGVAIELLVYRALYRKNASKAVFMISSLGAYIVIVNLIAMCFGSDAKLLRAGAESTVRIGDATLTAVQIVQLVTAGLVISIYWAFLERLSLGRACRAVADDPTLAALVGIRVDRSRVVVIAAGSLLGGIGAILIALDVGVDPYAGFPIVLVAAIACIVGGLHRFMAPALGGVLLGLTESLVVWKTSAKWEDAVTFGIMIAFLLLRPEGLLGMRRRLEEQ
jgi:branched-chain amino acid transport system permease protein